MVFNWRAMYLGHKLFVEIPKSTLPSCSKESFIMLLEYAEDVLRCSHVIICFKKDRPDRENLVKIFMFLGFHLVPPGHVLAPSSSGNIMYLAYAVDDDSDDGEF
ncbi:hypothetical protein HELRODRAFT_79864 [Helobdella robusta]|uniref:Ornithine decarboxylase antizyme n=1 Tax=Helobdella robusta TaxID=6412 RepID=T1G3U6_HELRO|nr:hypothetical protein HELRODRAFT_79864 [Helobdella robusta]ESO03628.1 hypothetical protein HELRODRAFT_79864 [Helobdella robusta]